MSDEEIRQAARQVVMEILELEPDEVDDGADFNKDLGGDSIQKLELIVSLEKRFNIHYAPDEAAGMNSIEDIVRVTKNYA